MTNTASVAFENETGDSFTRTSSASFNSTAGPVLTLIKSASATDLYPGRETTFTLAVANAGSSAAPLLTVLDTFPALLEYVPGSGIPAPDAVLGPVPGSTGRLLWSIASLPPGASRYVTFRARALDPGGSALIEHNVAVAHCDRPGGLLRSSASASVDVTVRPLAAPSPPGALSAIVRGRAVELNWVASSPGSDPVSGYRVYRGSYSGWTPSPATLAGTAYGASATAFGDPGAAAVGYCYVVRAFDSAGRESADSPRACVTAVAPADVHLLVQVFDVTGRLVKTLLDVWVTEPAGITQVGDGSGGVNLDSLTPVTVTLTNGVRLAWDGRDDSGARLPSGIYLVRATSIHPDGRRSVAVSTFAMRRAYTKLVESAVLVPNPAGEAAWISYRLASTASTVDVKVYDVAGELVYRGEAEGTAVAFRWDLRNRSGDRVAPGLYLVVLDVHDLLNGGRERVIRKLAVQNR